ncbi:large ribosomal subunit protein uL23m-like isoform X2 [Artemia franciscana]|nr:hypothetical protein QYM36_009318 [Artemia franciscana]
MKVVKPAKAIPPNKVHLMVSNEMTEYDVRNYLEKIYNIKPITVKVNMMQGRFRKNEKNYIVKDDDYKMAYITLAKDETFEFPELFPKGEDEYEKQKDQVEEAKKVFRERQKVNQNRPGIPSWFGI